MQISLPGKERESLSMRRSISFIIMHAAPFFLILTGATLFDWVLFASLYVIRIFFITAGYHRYFSHKTFKTSRWFQLFLAFMAQTSAQKGVLWWASNHRVHHKHSDSVHDPHSMKQFGFFYSHIGWIMSRDWEKTRYDKIKDFAGYPELRWLNKYYYVPAIILGVVTAMLGAVFNTGATGLEIFPAMFSEGGMSALLLGFFAGTVAVYHATFSINSLMHRIGRKRYETGDESRNSAILALITLGEGWHNNHHYYQGSARNGFYWWEFDFTWYGLKVLSWLGLIWDLKPVPEHIKKSRTKEEARRLKLAADRGRQPEPA